MTKYSSRNWIDLEVATSCSTLADKHYHVSCMLFRKKVKSSTATPEVETPVFLELIYLLRLKCILLAYFGKNHEYTSVLSEIEGHDGWNDFMNSHEKKILFTFDRVAKLLESGVTSRAYSAFTTNDKIFGEYRHQRWLHSN